MKGVVLSLPVKSRQKNVNTKFLFTGAKRNLFLIFNALFFTAGIIWGAVVELKADEAFLLNMDFLFTTNLDSRLEESFLSTFMAHFASNFIFFCAALFCGLSPFGVGLIPLVSAFKGFGTGLSAAFLMSTFGLKGLGFYIVVVLPGTFVFSLVLLYMGNESMRISLKIAKAFFAQGEEILPLSKFVRRYLFRCTWFLLMSAAGALVDMLLWSFGSKLFF
ncbi:MAG: hypothetical protein IJZ54_05030 [Clostridia bacterium]|nr:hypothetical protein [Clostridia bacterium]